jgi:CRP/FNR family transcriptional regulator, cyclic AMP receptor protein
MPVKRKRSLTPTAFLRQPGSGRTIRTYGDKEVIYSQESPANGVFYVQTGMVKLTAASKLRRKTAVLAILQEGDLFGDCCLGGQTRRMSSATSIGPCTITYLDKNTFQHKLNRDPVFAAMFIRYLVAQNARLKAALADHALNFCERRLARILLMHGSLAQKLKGEPSSVRFSQTTLAEMVGTTRSRISSFMNEFRTKGYIRYNGSLEVDTELLTNFLDG